MIRIKHAGIALSAAFLMMTIQVSAQKEIREAQDFNRVNFSIPGTLEIEQGDHEGLILMGDKDDLEKIVTKVEDGTLKIKKVKGSAKLTKDVTAKLVVKELKELSVNGSGDVIFNTTFKAGEFEMNISGSGDIKCDRLLVNELEINIAGSGDMDLGGEVDTDFEISIAGSGDVNAPDLKAASVEVSIAGSGDAVVWATDELETSIAGSGSVRYKGDPKVNAEIRGSGSTSSY